MKSSLRPDFHLKNISSKLNMFPLENIESGKVDFKKLLKVILMKINRNLQVKIASVLIMFVRRFIVQAPSHQTHKKFMKRSLPRVVGSKQVSFVCCSFALCSRSPTWAQPAATIEDIKKFLMMIVSQKDSTPYFLFPVFCKKINDFEIRAPIDRKYLLPASKFYHPP